MGWTLNLEVYFYIIFALTLLGKKTYAPTITTVIITIFWMVGFFTNGLGIGHLEFYSSGYIPYFSAGIATYCAWRKLKDVAKKNTSGPIIIAHKLVHSRPSSSAIIHPFAPSALVLGVLLLHSVGKRIEHPLLLLIGSASYALYLIHTIILEMARTLQNEIPILRYNTNIMAAIFAVAVCSILSTIIHLGIEKPIVKSF